MLEVRSVTVRRGRTVLDDISLRVPRGKITGLLGENGSGKSTLLRAVCGALPYRGDILWDGVSLNQITAKQRARIVTCMTQEPPRAEGLTVSEYVSFGNYARDAAFGGGTRSSEKAEALAARFDMTALLSKELSRMSVGERQMASLLRVAVQDTPAVLFDEPTGALDLRNAGRMLSYLRECAAEGKAVLCVLHDPAAALSVCDTLYLLENGRLSAPFSCRNAEPRAAEAFLAPLSPGLHAGRDVSTGLWYCLREIPGEKFADERDAL